MKIAGLHALSHTDSKEHAKDCDVCEHAIILTLTPNINVDVQCFSSKNIDFIQQIETLKTYNFIASNSITIENLFSRPPPFYM